MYFLNYNSAVYSQVTSHALGSSLIFHKRLLIDPLCSASVQPVFAIAILVLFLVFFLPPMWTTSYTHIFESHQEEWMDHPSGEYRKGIYLKVKKDIMDYRRERQIKLAIPIDDALIDVGFVWYRQN